MALAECVTEYGFFCHKSGKPKAGCPRAGEMPGQGVGSEWVGKHPQGAGGVGWDGGFVEGRGGQRRGGEEKCACVYLGPW